MNKIDYIKNNMMKELQEAQLTFLEETTQHYNALNRCIGKNGCQYSPIEGISEGCAIGRHIKDKEVCQQLDNISYLGNTVISICNNKAFELLPSELKMLTKDFLAIIQRLHDGKTYWNDKGLSNKGKEAIDVIKKGILNGDYIK